MPGDYRDLFQHSAESYDRTVFEPGTYDHWVWQREQAYLLDILARHYQGKTIDLLDFACGPGRIIAFLEPHVATSTGIDVAQPAIDLAREKLHKSTLVCGDITRDASLLSGPYNLITTFRFFLKAQESLRHAGLGALSKLLAPDGLLVIGVHGNDLSLRAMSTFVRGRILRQQVHSLSKRELDRLLGRYGLRIVEFRGITPLTRRMWATTPNAARKWLDRRVSRSAALQQVCLNLVIVAAPVARV